MQISTLTVDGKGTKEEYEKWKASEGQLVKTSPLGPLPNPLRLTDVRANGPESEPEVPFTLYFRA
jgi:hypothetical protein